MLPPLSPGPSPLGDSRGHRFLQSSGDRSRSRAPRRSRPHPGPAPGHLRRPGGRRPRDV